MEEVSDFPRVWQISSYTALSSSEAAEPMGSADDDGSCTPACFHSSHTALAFPADWIDLFLLSNFACMNVNVSVLYVSGIFVFAQWGSDGGERMLSFVFL